MVHPILLLLWSRNAADLLKKLDFVKILGPLKKFTKWGLYCTEHKSGINASCVFWETLVVLVITVCSEIWQRKIYLWKIPRIVTCGLQSCNATSQCLKIIPKVLLWGHIAAFIIRTRLKIISSVWPRVFSSTKIARF